MAVYQCPNPKCKEIYEKLPDNGICCKCYSTDNFHWTCRKVPDAGAGGFPRRARVNLMTKAERLILEAAWAVEELGAHELLTDAVNLLSQARDKVADFVELED